MPIAWIEHEGSQYALEDMDNPTLLESYPRSYLAGAVEDRPWTGVPSVTQLIAGLRETYLKITTDYGVDPADRAFAYIGTRAHYRLEQQAESVGLTPELRLNLPIGVSGMRDLVEPYGGANRLVDYKVIGSYKVRLLANTKNDQTVEERRANWNDYGMQLNAYRIMAQEEGTVLHATHPVWLFGIVRDGGTISARTNKVMAKTFMVPGPVWPDDKIISWFAGRRRSLLDHLDKGVAPPLCSNHETWNGRKCNGYCEVAKTCKALQREGK